MKRAQKSFIFIALSTLPAVALAADSAAILRCRAIADPGPRLACYDTLPASAPGAAPRVVSPVPKAQPPSGSPAPAATTPEGLFPRQAPEQFGLERKAADVELAKIESRIAGRFEGFRPNLRIRLANGQVWQVADDTRRIDDLDSPRVTIERGALGVFYLNIDGQMLTVRVKRVE